MMRATTILFVGALALGLAACGTGGTGDTSSDAVQQQAPPPQQQASPKVQKAVELAKAVQADPPRADAILAEHGSSRAEFEALIYEIAMDPELSRDYTKALR